MICTATFTQMWLAGKPTRIIAETLKISADRCDVTRRELKLPPRESWHGSKKGHRRAYMPSAEEIKAKCEEFQKGWSDEERAKRLVGYNPNRPAVEVKVIPEGVLRANFSSLIEETSGRGMIEDLTDVSTSGDS